MRKIIRKYANVPLYVYNVGDYVMIRNFDTTACVNKKTYT